MGDAGAGDARGREGARRGWRPRSSGEVALLVAVAVAALILRTVALETMPYGVHGDEANTGIDAQRVLDGEKVFPYTPNALGQPAGPMYLAAPFVAALGPTAAAVRLPMAFLGVGTVILGYFVARELFGRGTAVAFSVLLACSWWLIHYNRTGFTASAMPFTEMASVLAVALALRHRTMAWSAGAGAIVGLGIYGYYAYPLFALGLGVWVLLHALIERPWHAPVSWRAHARNLAIMGAVALAMTQPMWHYLESDDRGYRHDRSPFVVSATEEYKSEDFAGQVRLYAINAGDMIESLALDATYDGSDGSGLHTGLDPLAVALVLAGTGFALLQAVRTRRAAYLLPLVIVPIVLIGPISTIGSYQRRSLGILPFVLMYAALPLGYAIDRARAMQRDGAERRWAMQAAYGGAALVLAAYAAINAERYFGPKSVPELQMVHRTFSADLYRTLLFADGEPEDIPIYLASERRPADAEAIRYKLHGREAPVIDVVSRWVRGDDPTRYEDIDRTKGAIIVLMGVHEADADTINGIYPGALRVTGPVVQNQPAFIAFRVPPRP